ncbi:MAG: FAD-dependent oxidoreductase [Chloroflexi bacterium]|nr:FAD-dependent oxidoreductase [Chloroflexota bacterium]
MQPTSSPIPATDQKRAGYFPDDANVQPPCQFACPIHQDVRAYVGLSSLGRFREARGIVRETNPLPFICGTICAHPCESKCRREKADQPISIRALKRAALEQGRREPVIANAPKRSEKVAIVGAGPAGLTAAHDLSLMGFQVTVFEREKAAGGALSSAIPLYRLPRHVIEEDVDGIRTLGVRIETGVALGTDLTLDQLKKDGFRAVLLALGLPVSRSLNIPGIASENVYLALPFLRAVNSAGFRFKPGREVIVIGGGNVAMDVARSALRCGAERVKIACLEARHEMPAFPWEIEEAAEEGIEVNCSLGPRELLVHECDITGLGCKAVRAVFDSQGRFNPTFYEDRMSTISGNTVIIAIGQAADLQCLKGSPVQLSERGQVIYDRNTLATTDRGVFVSGEVAIGPATAVQAMASGRKAASSIAEFLSGNQVPADYDREPKELDKLADSTVEKIKRNPRVAVPMADLRKRVTNLEPVDLGYDAGMAVAEARRCLSCGAGAFRIPDKCIECLTCVRVCPYGVPVVTASNSVDIRLDQCQACGLCVGECPARAIGFRKSGEVDLPGQVELALNNMPAPKIVTFYCSFISRGKNGDSPAIPDNGIPVPCVSRVDVNTVLAAFEKGADGVVIASCEEGNCPYRNMPVWGEKRAKAAQGIMKELGLDQKRLEFHVVPSAQATQVASLAPAMAGRLKE